MAIKLAFVFFFSFMHEWMSILQSEAVSCKTTERFPWECSALGCACGCACVFYSLATPDARPYSSPPPSACVWKRCAGGGHFSCRMKLYSRVLTKRLVRVRLERERERSKYHYSITVTLPAYFSVFPVLTADIHIRKEGRFSHRLDLIFVHFKRFYFNVKICNS